MMWNRLFRTVVLAAVFAHAAAQETMEPAQDTMEPVAPDDAPEADGLQPLLDAPMLKWEFQLLADVNLGPTDVLKGNGVFMAPDGKTALVTTVGATVYAFDAYSGEQKWLYQPEAVGSSITRSHSGVSFGPSVDYMVYSVVDNENSLTPETRVIALDMDGTELWISDPLDGIPSGEPLISSDGSFVFVVHNAMESSMGYFTILDANATGVVFYSESGGGDGNSTTAFGPPGIYHTPVVGNYDPVDGGTISAGDFNTNDMIMWSQTPKPTDTAVEDGFMYGFQFPRDFNGNLTGVGFFQLGDFIRDFQSITPPVMTNGGLSAYWSVTRSAYQGWASKRFSRARTGAVGFTRNADVPGQSCYAAPALSSSQDEPFVFGGSASTEFVRLNYDLTEQVVVSTSSLIMSKAAVDGEDRCAYYVEMSGVLHQADFDTLDDLWNYTINFSVEGEMAMTANSDVIVVADTRGFIKAIQVAEVGATVSPSVFPSDMPSMAPTGNPLLGGPTAVPTGTFEPTSANGTDTDTDFPTAGSTDSPVSAPVAPPDVGTFPTTAPTVPTVGTTPPTNTTTAPVAAPTSAASRPIMAVALFASIACLFV